MATHETVIGFIGLGVMGKSMASRLQKAGYLLVVYSRTKPRDLLELEVEWADSVKDVAKKSNVLITMVGYPSDVEDIYLGSHGIVANAKSGTYLIDMTTSTPELAKRIDEESRKRNIHAVDAPVSGGDIGAREGTLTIMVGGDHSDFEYVKPILSAMGKNILLQGPAGAGQHTKMCNQIAIASNMLGVCEAMSYATRAGLDPARVLQSIGAGAAASWSLTTLAPRMIERNFEPGFYVKHFIKDMNIALQSAKEMGLLTPGLELAKSLYEQLELNGHTDSGTHALYTLYENPKATQA